MLGLIVFAILGGPLIFYGLLAMGKAGVFDGIGESFLLFAGAGIAIVFALSAAMLFIGSRATTNSVNQDQANG